MKKLIIAMVACLLLAYGAYYLFWHTASPAGSAHELVTLAPAESEWTLYLDFAAWRASPVISELSKLMPHPEVNAAYREFQQSTGFDYSRDLDRAVLALLPIADAKFRRDSAFQVVAFADGRFNREKISAHALKFGAREFHNGTEMILTRSADSQAAAKPQQDSVLLAFLSDRRIAIAGVPGGSAAAHARGRDAILAATSQTSQPGAQLPHAERAARVAGAPFFAVGRAQSLMQAAAALPLPAFARQVPAILSDVRWLTIAARPEPNHIRLSFYGECDSAWKAGQLGLLLDGALLFSRNALKDPKTRAQLPPGKAAEIDTLLATARVERQSNIVEVRLQLPLAFLSAPVKSAQR